MTDASVPPELPPEEVLAAARTAYRMRRPDATPAALLSDSATDPVPGLRREPGPSPRLLAFGAGEWELHLHVTVRGDVCDLAGQLIPPSRCTVELRRADGVSRHAGDAGGAFVVRSVPRGPASLVCFPVGSSAPALSVPWTVF